ncbi:hypothetical protein PMAYCL1PPCAC_14681, partial [Pristionchus mayeri]
ICSKVYLATSICVQFAGREGECMASVKARDVTDVLTVCQCESHECTSMLSTVLPLMSKDVSSLSLEDELIGERLSDSAAHVLLDGCSGAPLSCLSFEHVDFSAVRPWTLALIASFDRLEEVNNSSSIGLSNIILSSINIFIPFRSLSVTDSSHASDKLWSTLARGAPCLVEISLRGCHNVSAASLVALLEGAERRRAQLLTLRMEDTAFCSEQLERFMRSSLMPSGREWAVTRMRCELGYATPALLLTHPGGKAILVYD